MDLENFSKYEQSGENYEKHDNWIKWNNVTRNSPGHIYFKKDDPITNFEINFDFVVYNINNYSENFRHLFTLFKLRKEPGTIMSLYIAEVKNNNIYKVIFFQRKNRENIFVYRIGKNFKVGKKYSVKITKKQFVFRIRVEIDSDEFDDSGDLEGINDEYLEVFVCEGHRFDVDSLDSSSGKLENLSLEIIEDVEISEEKKPISLDEPKKAFISFCKVSGDDFASHLDLCLKRNGIDTFYSEKSIEVGSDWEETIKQNINESRFLILIMTPGFDISKAIRDELNYAYDFGKEVLPFKHEPLHKKHLCVDLGSEIKDFNSEQYKVFTTKEELCRIVYYELDAQKWFSIQSDCTKYDKEE
jgi:hypothetical protein